MSAVRRWYILADLDAFFASVEELLNPALRGKPLIVGGDPRSRSVVCSASYAARAYGVRSAMPMARAVRMCPQAIIVPPRHGVYGEHSQAVMDILRAITPAVEQVSIDEAYLDITGCERLWGSPYEIGRLIQRRVHEEQHLPISLGIAANKLVAKIACDTGKPRGLVLVSPGEEQPFLSPLPIERLLGVGKVTGAHLREYGVLTIGDILPWPEERLVATFGELGHMLYRGARGQDDGVVHSARERRSVSQEITFEVDIDERAPLEQALLGMSDRVAAHLRAYHLVAQTVRIKLRYPDFSIATRQTTLPQPTDQGQMIYREAQTLLTRHWKPGQPLRLLGVGVSGLLDEGGYQLDLFDASDQKRIRLNRSLDEIRARYGSRAIRRASLLPPDKDEEPPTA
jgi:DNA polymerase-4